MYYYIYRNNINDSDIEHLKNYTKLYICNNKLNHNLINILKNITDLVINDMENIINVSNNIKYIEFGATYINKFPEILQLLPYGIETLVINGGNLIEINLNNLPKSIKKINIYLDNIETKILINVLYPNLKSINIYDGNIENKDEINKYFNNNNIEVNYKLLKKYESIVII